MTLLGLLFLAKLQAQVDTSFISPFKFPLLLSANFGELRPNHFHNGIDIKTQGVTGKPIYCIADGYVSRILVLHGGYGQALFVTHPNGYTSVYGHVIKFAPAIQNSGVSIQNSTESRPAVFMAAKISGVLYEWKNILDASSLYMKDSCTQESK